MAGVRRENIRFYVLVVLLVIAVGLAVSQYRLARASRLEVITNRQRALFNLINHTEIMESSMAKARAASSPEQKIRFLTACWYHSGAAQEAVSVSSIASLDLGRVKQFFGQVGDYVHSLSQKIASGDVVTGDDWAELERLETTVRDLGTMLADMGSRVAVTGAWPAGRFSLFGLQAAPPDDALFRGFSEVDELLQTVQAPVYDGPFSEQNLRQKGISPLFRGADITDERAKEIGLSFIPGDDSWESVRVERIEGAIPCFMVTGKRRDGTEVSAAVSRSGGHVLWVQDSRLPGVPRLSLDDARDRARKFLDSRGFKDLVETGWRKGTPASSRVVFAFVPTVSSGGNRVVLYPDTVKVEVALDTGRIIAFDQTAYLTNHTERTFPSSLLYDSRQAARVLDPGLKVLGAPRLVVAPTSPTREILAWEFKVQHGQDTYLVYINAQTGREEVVLRVIESDAGAVTS